MPNKTVKCPTCKKEVEFSESNPHRPFCSERCKLIDLGAWADGSNYIPGESVDPYSVTPTLNDTDPSIN